MRVFKASEQIAGLISVACCYMKLSCDNEVLSCDNEVPSCDNEVTSLEAVGYPLSDFVRLLLPNSALSYQAREVACHSIEIYYQQLQGS